MTKEQVMAIITANHQLVERCADILRKMGKEYPPHPGQVVLDFASDKVTVRWPATHNDGFGYGMAKEEIEFSLVLLSMDELASWHRNQERIKREREELRQQEILAQIEKTERETLAKLKAKYDPQR